ncbi:hypothetical protein TNCV_114311 [Trichonephila clavipes]|nr:hypothetical protein TNCV_114311 [Trichonephila clavipes]
MVGQRDEHFLVIILSHFSIRDILQSVQREGTADQSDRSHPPQFPTSHEDRQIVRITVTDRLVTSRTIAQQIESVALHSVSARTIRRHLQQVVYPQDVHCLVYP